MTAPMVFAIRPRYVAALLDGSKSVEYRTRRPGVFDGELVLIYETAPRSMIVAEARVVRVIEGEPDRVWSRTRTRGGITAAEFESYFYGRARAIAIELDVRGIDPAPLPDGMRAPQAWARLHGEWARRG